MCELFAISSRLPATVSLSLKTLAEHGGGSAPHADGWGIAYYRDDDVRLIKDTDVASVLARNSHLSQWPAHSPGQVRYRFPALLRESLLLLLVHSVPVILFHYSLVVLSADSLVDRPGCNQGN